MACLQACRTNAKRRPASAAISHSDPATKTKHSQFDLFILSTVTTITDKLAHERRDSYQGTPSGVPNKRKQKAGFSRRLWPSPPDAPTLSA
jgi:hypothetical protein